MSTAEELEAQTLLNIALLNQIEFLSSPANELRSYMWYDRRKLWVPPHWLSMTHPPITYILSRSVDTVDVELIKDLQQWRDAGFILPR